MKSSSSGLIFVHALSMLNENDSSHLNTGMKYLARPGARIDLPKGVPRAPFGGRLFVAHYSNRAEEGDYEYYANRSRECAATLGRMRHTPLSDWI
jgi:hypothetical protein